jgi:hypothetical protein
MTWATDVTGGARVSAQRNPVPGISAAVTRIKAWANVGLEQNLSAGVNWGKVSTQKDGSFVVFFGAGGKHVVAGRVMGGTKQLIDVGDLRRTVSLQEMTAKWGQVSGIYNVLD